MGVLKNLTYEYFGDATREEDFIDITDLSVEIVSFTDSNGHHHGHGYRVDDGFDENEMMETLDELIKRMMDVRGTKCSLNDIDVSNIKRMNKSDEYGNCWGLFFRSEFDGDISGWDVSNAVDMNNMFFGSKFTGKNGMFTLKKGNRVEDIGGMFYNSCFDSDISDWDVQNVEIFTNAFVGTPLAKLRKLPKWYKERKK